MRLETKVKGEVLRCVGISYVEDGESTLFYCPIVGVCESYGYKSVDYTNTNIKMISF